MSNSEKIKTVQQRNSAIRQAVRPQLNFDNPNPLANPLPKMQDEDSGIHTSASDYESSSGPVVQSG